MAVEADLDPQGSLERLHPSPHVGGEHRAGGVGDVDAIHACGLEQPGLIAKELWWPQVAHHQESDHFHPHRLGGLDVLQAEVGLGAERRDAGNPSSVREGPAQVVDGADSRQEHAGDRRLPAGSGCRSWLPLSAVKHAGSGH